jgi:hypothetical protein
MDEEQAKEKIKQIETKVRDAILQETTTIRTKVKRPPLHRSVEYANIKLSMQSPLLHHTLHDTSRLFFESINPSLRF